MNIRRITFSVVLLTSLLLGACGGGASSQTTLAVSGAFALYPLMQRFAEEYTAAHPDVVFDITAGGAGKGMADVLAGAVDLAMVSREVKQEETDQGAYAIAVARDAVFPDVSASNPYLAQILAQGFTPEALYKVFITKEFTTWGDLLGDSSITDPINVYTRSDSAGAAEMFSKGIGGESQEDLQGIGVDGDPGVLNAVINDPLGIGYNNLGYVYDMATNAPIEGVIVAPMDWNGNGVVDEHELLETRSEAEAAILSGDYPSPPARLLYLVTKGQPTGATLDLLKWILADGQAFVSESGYVQLTAEELATEIAKLPN